MIPEMNRLRTLVFPLAATVILVVAALLRVARREGVEVRGPDLELFRSPPARVPLLDIIAWPFGAERTSIVLLLSLLGVATVGMLVRRALPEWGRLAVMTLAAVCPTLILTGAVFSTHGLVVLCSSITCIALIDVLRWGGNSSPPWALFVSTAALLVSDWPAASPVLAWCGWLLFFRPAWLDPSRAKRALLGLSSGAVVAGTAYGWVLANGARPTETLGAADFPRGLEAANQLLSSISGLWLGTSTEAALSLRFTVGSVLVLGALIGWKRAHRAGAPAWGSVLLVGSLGAMVPALAIQQALPFAAYKNIWFMTPMVLCLGIAAVWPIVSFESETHPPQPRAQTAHAGAFTLLFLGLISLTIGCTDHDLDGWSIESGDCDDQEGSIYPGAPEIWKDGLDNNCDGEIDWSHDYVLLEEQEPNDSSLGSCFAPEGQDLGRIAGEQLLTRISGDIESVVDGSYEEGDRDCYAFRLPSVENHPRLSLELSWDDPSTDLDIALQGLWQGVQAGFAQSQASGPGPEALVSSSGFDSGALLWIWVVAYDGPPTSYQLDLVLR
jgi:hypothetical protein